MTREQKDQLEKSKKELKDYIYDKKWVDERLEDIKERRGLIDKITHTLSDMPKGSPKVQDGQAESLVDLIDLTNEMENYLKELRIKQINIENKINKLSQPYKNILYFRYIRGYNLTEVANEIEAEYDYTRKLHGAALIKYAQLGDNNG